EWNHRRQQYGGLHRFHQRFVYRAFRCSVSGHRHGTRYERGRTRCRWKRRGDDHESGTAAARTGDDRNFTQVNKCACGSPEGLRSYREEYGCNYRHLESEWSYRRQYNRWENQLQWRVHGAEFCSDSSGSLGYCNQHSRPYKISNGGGNHQAAELSEDSSSESLQRRCLLIFALDLTFYLANQNRELCDSEITGTGQVRQPRQPK